MRFLIIFVILALATGYNGFSQNKDKPKVWIGIWDYKLKYQGTYQIDSILVNPVWNKLYNLKVEAIQKLINGPNEWHYILIAKDSLEVLNTNTLMQKININNHKYKWEYDYNGYLSFLRDRERPPRTEFLPDGHWIYFSTEKGKVGVSRENYIKNHQIFKFSKIYNLETGLEEEYFEVENGLLNGILYCEEKGRINGILRYKDGVLIESLYNRNE